MAERKRYKYVILKTESFGRGKIHSKKITHITYFYSNMSFLYSSKHKLKPCDKIQVKKFVIQGKYRYPVEHFFSGTVEDFIKKAEGIAKKYDMRRILTLRKKI
jgi:hypothetical protein